MYADAHSRTHALTHARNHHDCELSTAQNPSDDRNNAQGAHARGPVPRVCPGGPPWELALRPTRCTTDKEIGPAEALNPGGWTRRDLAARGRSGARPDRLQTVISSKAPTPALPTKGVMPMGMQARPIVRLISHPRHCRDRRATTSHEAYVEVKARESQQQSAHNSRIGTTRNQESKTIYAPSLWFECSRPCARHACGKRRNDSAKDAGGEARRSKVGAAHRKPRVAEVCGAPGRGHGLRRQLMPKDRSWSAQPLSNGSCVAGRVARPFATLLRRPDPPTAALIHGTRRSCEAGGRGVD